MSEIDRLTNLALAAVGRAVALCRAVAAQEVRPESLTKKDRSPVTVADLGAQAVVSWTLTLSVPEIPIVGEESSGILHEPAAAELRQKVVAHTAQILGLEHQAAGAREATVLAAIDRCGDPGGARGYRWVLDPIDGTKGFMRGEQYAVALALLDNGVPVLGVLGCPNLPTLAPGQVTPGAFFVARRGRGALQIDDAGSAPELSRGRALVVAATTEPRDAVFCESVESGHSAHDRHQAIARHLGVLAPAVRMDSQCKYAAVGRGEAALYLRLPTDEVYREKIWDHAAGWMVVTEAGGRVTDIDGEALDFSSGRTFPRSRGVVASNGRLHDAVIEAIRATAG